MLVRCALGPDEVTLVPGNHDLYTSPMAWLDALDGPLRAWSRNAAREQGKVVDLGETIILPIDATFHQPVTRSAGRLDEAVEEAVAARLADPRFASRHVIVAIHHPPHPRPGPWHWVDGLLGGKRLLAMIAGRPNVIVAHGHLHRHEVRDHAGASVIGAAAVVDGAHALFIGERRELFASA